MQGAINVINVSKCYYLRMQSEEVGQMGVPVDLVDEVGDLTEKASVHCVDTPNIRHSAWLHIDLFFIFYSSK